MLDLRWGKQLDIRAFLIFQRIMRFYKTFVVLAALIGGLAVAALTFPEFHPTKNGFTQASEGFLCSSAITSVISAVAATMLLFQFEGLERATRRDLAVAWLPLILLDISILELLLGVVCWYSGKAVYWGAVVMATQFAGLVIICIILSIWMWFYMSRKGGLGKDDTQVAITHQRVADK